MVWGGYDRICQAFFVSSSHAKVVKAKIGKTLVVIDKPHRSELQRCLSLVINFCAIFLVVLQPGSGHLSFLVRQKRDDSRIHGLSLRVDHPRLSDICDCLDALSTRFSSKQDITVIIAPIFLLIACSLSSCVYP